MSHRDLEWMVAAARSAGRSLMSDFKRLSALSVHRKGRGDYVSDADLKSESRIRTILAEGNPDAGFLMEESGRIEGRRTGHVFIVDPLDGTTNFLRGLPWFAVTIASERDGELVAGVTYDPLHERMFTALRGGGARLNDVPIRVSETGDLAEAFLALGGPTAGHGNQRLDYDRFAATTAGFRRAGSAALELAFVASGQFEAYVEDGQSPWDIAAGILLVREAGGAVSDWQGGDAMLRSGSVVAGNGLVNRPVLELLSS